MIVMINVKYIAPFSRAITTLLNSQMIYSFICATVLCAIFQVFFLLKAKKKEESVSLRHFVWVYIFLVYITLVYQMTGVTTIWSIIDRVDMWRQWGTPIIDVNRIYLVPFVSSAKAPYLYNILMTIPLGFLLALLWPQFRSVKKVALTGFCLSLAIEVSQLFSIRATMVDDLVANTLGAVLGYLIFLILYSIFQLTMKIINKQSMPVSANNSRCKGTSASKFSSYIIRNEPIIYIVLSFVGYALFFNLDFYFRYFLM
jgi:glycopeptide antibiotics resistance protein